MNEAATEVKGKSTAPKEQEENGDNKQHAAESNLDPHSAVYVISKCLNTEAFTKSAANPKAIATTSTPLNNRSDKGAMSHPHRASVKAIAISATDDKTSQCPGRGNA